jgi:putative nucleotidyltransferase with HDIG domain
MPSRVASCQTKSAGCEGCSREVSPAADAGEQAPTLDALGRTLEARDPDTHHHAQRVQRYAVALAREHAIQDSTMLEAIRAAALLHDIGKLAIPGDVLHKPETLTASEYDCVKQHVTLGADMLAAVPFSGPLAEIVRHHHENWDGSGYPDGLSGETIPLGSRLLAIVDCFDALTSPRPYRDPMTPEIALAMIRERRGTMYDPQIVDVFLRMMAPGLSPSGDTGARRPRILPVHRARAL